MVNKNKLLIPPWPRQCGCKETPKFSAITRTQDGPLASSGFTVVVANAAAGPMTGDPGVSIDAGRSFIMKSEGPPGISFRVERLHGRFDGGGNRFG